MFSPESLITQGSRLVPGGAAVAGPLFAGGAIVLGAGIKSAAKVEQEKVGLRIHSGRARAVKDEKMLRWRKASTSGTKTGFFHHEAGELYGLVRPGLNWVMPGTHKMEVISTKNSNIDLANFMVMSTVNRQHEVDAVLTVGVVKEFDEKGKPIEYGIEYPELVYKALMAAENITEMAQGIGGICTEGLRHLLENMERPDFAKGQAVQPHLIQDTGEELLMTYGTEIRRLNIRAASYSAADMLVNGKAPAVSDAEPVMNGHLHMVEGQPDLVQIAATVPGLIPRISPEI